MSSPKKDIQERSVFTKEGTRPIRSLKDHVLQFEKPFPLRFIRALESLLEEEGALANDPSDPGGLTKYGISSRTYKDVDIASLTPEQAGEIYYRDWWLRYRYNQINNEDIAAKVMSFSVNAGPDDAHRALQMALHCVGMRHVKVDGIIGSQTLGAANLADPKALLPALKAFMVCHYLRRVDKSPASQRFLNGWLNRAYS